MKAVEVGEEDVGLGRHVVGRHARGRRGRGAVVAERRLIGDSVAVAGQQEVRGDPIQYRGSGGMSMASLDAGPWRFQGKKRNWSRMRDQSQATWPPSQTGRKGGR